MKGIQGTTVEALTTSSLSTPSKETDLLAFQHFLQAYAEPSMALEKFPEEVGIEEIGTEEEGNQEEVIEEEVLDEASVSLLTPTLEEGKVVTSDVSHSHPQYFHFYGEPEQELIATRVTEITEGNEETLLSVPLTSTPTENHGVVEQEPFLLAQEEIGEGKTATAFMVEDSPIDGENTETAALLPKGEQTKKEQAVIEQVTLSQEALPPGLPVARIEIPTQHLPQEGLDKAPEVPPAIIEKISQPIVEKIATMGTQGTQKITVELLPEKLGRMEVSIRVTDQKVQLEFVVENSQTRQLLEGMTTKLEGILNKQEFPTIAPQEKVAEVTPTATELQGDGNLFDQSAFQQGFQRERQQQNAFGKTAKSKTFAEIAKEKIEEIPGDGHVDLLV